jgi:hypothetical protein
LPEKLGKPCFVFRRKMLINAKNGQATMTEYIVIFFLAVGAVVSMSVFVQRGLQSRIHDTRTYMLNEAAKAYQGNILYEYEPYYGEVATNIARSQDDTTTLLEGGGTGIFRKLINQQVESSTQAQQAPPKDAK